jgi:hypothetical protein
MSFAVVAFEPVVFKPHRDLVEYLRARPEQVGVLALVPPKIRAEIEDLIRWAGSKSNYLENEIKNFWLGALASPRTAPATIAFGLWTAALTDASTGAAANEASYGSYARVGKTNDTTNFPTVGDDVTKKNGVAITFPTSSGGSNTVTYGGVTDNAGAGLGNMLLWGDLTTPRTVLSGDTPEYAVNTVTWDEQ